MKPVYKFSCCIGILFWTFTLFAQELPPISNYNPVDYNAESQNWDITQTADKVMFFANNSGLLEFNGATWQLYKNPNESIMRSVKAVGNRVYSGCYMDIGFWERDVKGHMVYTSLADKLESSVITDEEFWTIEQLDQWILFQSLDRILIYDTASESFREINAQNRITKMFLVNETIYFQRLQEGLFKIEQGKAVLVSDQMYFQEDPIVNVFGVSEGLKVVTQNNGSFLLAGDRTTRYSNWEEALNIKPSLYSAIELSSGHYAYGSIANGFFQFNEDLTLDYRIEQTNGLGNNTVLSIFQDIDQNIWLGYDNGIGCINTNSSLRIFRDLKGQIGSVYTSAIYENNLYLGTNHGLFYKPLNENVPFSFVEGSQGQVWCLYTIKDGLLVGHNLGTFLLNSNQLITVAEEQGTWIIKAIPDEPDLLLQGNYNGIYVLRNSNGIWQVRNKLKGFDVSTRFLEILGNKIFVNHEYKGLFTITVDDALNTAVNVEIDTAKKGNNSGLISFNNEVLFANQEGIHKYNGDKEIFERDSIYSTMYTKDNYLSGRLIADTSNDKLWNFSNNAINYFNSGRISNTPILNKLPISQSLRNSVSNYENVLQLDDKRYLIGTHFGYIIVNLDKQDLRPEEIRIDRLNAHSLRANTSTSMPLTDDIEISYSTHNVSFAYSVPEYDSYLTTTYQYRLEGIYDNWSEWTTSSSKLFENLPHGKYTFEVRAKKAESIETDVARFRFSIARPWYRSNAMIGVYILGLLIISFMIHKVYTGYYRRQRKELLSKAQTALELKEMENEQERMKYKNQQLQQDIDSKSRELAASTMNLIKKNEFLSSIKNELRKSKDQKSLSDIVKIIDNNLNSTDDWKLFEEAFNNADKGFLKKIKKRHDGLTPNDLRLCAYLRLNLSSKEIAPLLNISPRSVEVKRYRLRKKMNLPHETSLANYIINL